MKVEIGDKIAFCLEGTYGTGIVVRECDNLKDEDESVRDWVSYQIALVSVSELGMRLDEHRYENGDLWVGDFEVIGKADAENRFLVTPHPKSGFIITDSTTWKMTRSEPDPESTMQPTDAPELERMREFINRHVSPEDVLADYFGRD